MVQDDGQKSEVCQACAAIFIDQDVCLDEKKSGGGERRLGFERVLLSNPRVPFPGHEDILTP